MYETSTTHQGVVFYITRSDRPNLKPSLGTHSASGASLRSVGPPTISRLHTSLTNHAKWPTAQPMRSPAAALQVPFKIQARPTSARGRYGAVIVMSPNKDIGVEGWRRDHRYIGTNARGEERKGRLTSGERACVPIQYGHILVVGYECLRGALLRRRVATRHNPPSGLQMMILPTACCISY